jgi:hypothetical protein
VLPTHPALQDHSTRKRSIGGIHVSGAMYAWPGLGSLCRRFFKAGRQLPGDLARPIDWGGGTALYSGAAPPLTVENP